jgi:hypothetical protein
VPEHKADLLSGVPSYCPVQYDDTIVEKEISSSGMSRHLVKHHLKRLVKSIGSPVINDGK